MTRDRSRMAGWIDLGSDVNWADYHGKWGKKGPDGAWYVLRFTNLWDACGSDVGEDENGYECDVLRVDLREIPAEEIESAISSSWGRDGFEEMIENAAKHGHGEHGHDIREVATVEACVSYGIYALLDTISANAYPDRVRARARRSAEGYMRDEDKREERLDRTVNKIGSTARDFGRGDSLAGLHRYQEQVLMGARDADEPSMNLMSKLYGMPIAEIMPPPTKGEDK